MKNPNVKLVLFVILAVLTIQLATAIDYNYAIDDANSSLIWVTLNVTAGANISLTINNDTGTYAPSPDDIFLTYENGSRAIDVSKWTNASTVTVANGFVNVSGATGRLISVATWPIEDGLIFEANFITGGGADKYCHIELGTTNTITSSAPPGAGQNGSVYFTDTGATNLNKLYLNSRAGSTAYDGGGWNDIGFPSTTLYPISLWVRGQFTTGKRNTGSVAYNMSGQSFGGNYYVKLGSQNAWCAFDWLRLRKKYATEPTVLCVGNVCNISSTVNVTNYQLALSTTLGGALNVSDTPTGSSSLNVSLISPLNGTNSTTNTNTFTYNVSGTANLSNCTLYVDNAVNGSASNDLANGQYTFTRSFTDGAHGWRVMCVDSNLATNSTAWTLNVNTTLSVALVTPLDNAMTNTSSNVFTYNVSGTANLSNCTLYLNGSANGSASNGLANGQYTFTRNLSDDVYLWKVGCLDSNAATNTTARTLTVNTTTPLVVALVSPADGSTSNVTQNIFTYNVSGTANLSNCTLYLNGTAKASNASLPNGQYTFNVTTGNLTSYSWLVDCKDIYNNTNSSAWTLNVDTRPPPNMSILNVSVKNYAGVQITNFSVTIDGNFSMNVENSSVTSKSYIINQTFTDCGHDFEYHKFYEWTAPDVNVNVTNTRLSFYWPTTGNAAGRVVFGYVDGTQSANVTGSVISWAGWQQITLNNPNRAKYVRNISYYKYSETCYGSDTVRVDDVTATALSGGFYAIANVSAGTHALFVNAPGYAYGYANVTTTGATTYYNFTLYQERSFNFTIYDETTNAVILENFSIKLISDVFAANYTTGSGNLSVALLLPSEYQIIYSAVSNTSEYTYPRSYFATITNGSYEAIRLYSVKTSESQYLVPTVTDENGLLLENATITMIRGQIEGNSYVGYTVEMDRTDSEGRGLLRVVPNTVYYKFFVTHPSGSLTTNYFKITSGTIKFQLGDGSNPLTAFQNLLGVERTLTYNNASQTFIYNYLDSTNTVTQGCLEIRKTDQYGVRSVPSNTCANGSSGSVIYTLTDTNNSVYTAYGRLMTANGVGMVDVAEQSFKDGYNVFGLVGILFATVLFVFIIFLAAPSAEGVIISGILGIAIVGLFGFIAWNWTAFVGIIIIGGVTVYFMNRD